MKKSLLLLLVLQPTGSVLAMEQTQPPLTHLHQQANRLNQSQLAETQKKELERNRKKIEELEKKVGDLEAQEERSENLFFVCSGITLLSITVALYRVASGILR